ncbi:hypothetical protein [Glaciecola sp. SC05]|uniref:hypothetical protein n=1 Tax=Glaciecola sp. SC05 TaxID=1987355 RepID=UPI003527C54C
MMTLLDRYLAAVKQALPADKESDILRELKANMLDEADAHTENGETQDHAIQLVIEKYGHPLAVAQSYAPQAPLVAGEDMPLYQSVLMHGAVLIFIFSLLKTLSAMLVSDSLNPFRLVFQTFGNFVDHAALLLLVVTLSFYFLGKSGYLGKLRYKNWSLEKLPKYPDAKISLSDTLTDLVSTSFLLLLLWTSLWMSEEGQQALVFALSPSSEHWRIILTVISVASLVFALFRLTQASWQRWTLLSYIADHIVFSVAFLWMASLPELIIISKPEVAENWPFIQQAFESYFSYFLAITAVIIGFLGYLQIRKLNQLQ